MKKLIPLFVACLLGASMAAQTAAEIHGKVLDKDGLPIPGAYVECTNGAITRQEVSADDGRFRLKPLDAGKYNVVVKSMGMVACQVKDVVVNAGMITRLKDVVLQDSTYETGGVTIVEYVDPLINVDGSTVMTIRAKELKNMPSAKGGNIKNIVQSLTSDVKVGGRGEELYFRGSRNGSTLYFIDGVKVRENVPNIPQSGISSIQVYTGGVPAKYGDCTGGVVIIETRSYLEDFRWSAE